jgi:hypothetical protein
MQNPQKTPSEQAKKKKEESKVQRDGVLYVDLKLKEM